MPDTGTSGAGGGGQPEYTVHFDRGQIIFREGDAGEDMFIIKAGEVEITRDTGGRPQRLALLEEGDFFGEMAVLEEEPRMASARAATDCDLLRIDGSTFDQMVRHNPEIPIRMLRKLCRRLRQVGAGSVCVDEVHQAEPVEGEVDVEAVSSEPPMLVASLIHPVTGTEFKLVDADEIFIGRVDPATGFKPHVELRPIDPQRSTSRRHARIVRRADALYLREEIGVANGTFVNGQRLPKFAEVELHDGDELRFGLVKTVLKLH
jgi:hypothetical protein